MTRWEWILADAVAGIGVGLIVLAVVIDGVERRIEEQRGG